MHWEGEFLLWLQKNVRSEGATAFFRTVSRTVDGGALWLLLAGGMCLRKKTRRTGLLCFLSIGVELLLVNVALKNLVGRERPFQKIDGLEVLCRRPRDYSFPSGHTAVSFAAATAVFAGGYKRFGTLLLLYATLVGFSRMYLGVHYPTDVLAGAFIGASSAIGVKLTEKLFLKIGKKNPPEESG